MKITCQEAEQWLSQYIDGECPVERRGDVEVHLQECSTCRAALDAWARIGVASIDVLRGAIPRDPLKTMPKPVRKMTTRRRRATRTTSSAFPWNIALVAAGLLVSIIALATLYSSGGAPDLTHRTAPRIADTNHRSEQDRQKRERAQALTEAQARRLEAEARLREIEGKRQALSQPKPAPGDRATEEESRERELAELKREQDKIEQDLRASAELAKKAEKPTPAGSLEVAKPALPQTTPTPKQEKATKTAVAQVEEVSGEAFRVSSEGKMPAAVGAGVLAADGLETGGGASRLVLRFPDKTRVELGPDASASDFKIEKGKRLSVQKGTLRAIVAKQPKGEPMIILTPHGQAKVIGTTLRLVVDPDPKKGTKLEVEEGKVELSNLAGKTVLVESGHCAVAAVGVELVARVLPLRPRPSGYVWRNPQQPWGAILQTVPLVPDRTYTLSVWTLAAGGTFPGGSIGVRSESGAILAQKPFGGSESYVRTVLTFKAGSNRTVVVFAGFANSTNAPISMHLDDWSLVEKGGDGTNLVQDPDYEAQNQAAYEGRNDTYPLSGPWYSEGSSGGPIGLANHRGRIPANDNSAGEHK